MRTGLKKYFFNSSWSALEKLFRLLSGILIGVWVARYLEPANYGILTLSISISNFILAICSLGLENIVIRELVKGDRPSSTIIRSSTSLRFGIILFTIITGAIFLLATESNNNIAKITYILLFQGIFQSFYSIDWYYQSKVNIKLVAIANIIGMIFSGLCKVILIQIKADIIFFPFAFILETAVISILLILFLKVLDKDNYYGPILTIPDKAISLFLLKDSYPLILGGLVTSLYMKIDQLMIRLIYSNYEVGIYSVSVRLAELFNLIPLILGAALYPAILNARKISKKLYLNRIESLISLNIYLAIVIATGMMFLSEFLITEMYGQDYVEAIPILKTNIWGTIFVFSGIIASKWIITENLQNYYNLFIVISLCVNMILNIIFTDIYGLIGAAYSTLVSQILANLILPLLSKKTRLQGRMIVNGINPSRVVYIIKSYITK